MTIKYNETKKIWEAYHSARHPISRQPITLRRQATTEAEAKKIERQLIRRVADRLMEASCPSWKRLIREFLEDCRVRDLTNHSISDYRTGLEAYTFEPWSNKRIRDITTEDIRRLVKEGPIALKSQGHQKNLFKFIRAAFTFAIEHGYLSRNPCPRIKFKSEKKIKRVLTEEQVKQLLQAAKGTDSEWYEIWAGAVYTGMRNGELFALKWDKVNLPERLILVSTSWSKLDGYKSTKSGDDRHVEIAAPLLAVLKELKLKSGGNSFVFPRLPKWESGEQARELGKFLKAIGLPVVRFHDLRATWATILLSKGVEAVKVMAAGGWKDYATMMIYMELTGLNIRGMSDVLDLHDPNWEPGVAIPLKHAGKGHQE